MVHRRKASWLSQRSIPTLHVRTASHQTSRQTAKIMSRCRSAAPHRRWPHRTPAMLQSSACSRQRPKQATLVRSQWLQADCPSCHGVSYVLPIYQETWHIQALEHHHATVEIIPFTSPSAQGSLDEVDARVPYLALGLMVNTSFPPARTFHAHPQKLAHPSLTAVCAPG